MTIKSTAITLVASEYSHLDGCAVALAVRFVNMARAPYGLILVPTKCVTDTSLFFNWLYSALPLMFNMVFLHAIRASVSLSIRFKRFVKSDSTVGNVSIKS